MTLSLLLLLFNERKASEFNIGICPLTIESCHSNRSKTARVFFFVHFPPTAYKNYIYNYICKLLQVPKLYNHPISSSSYDSKTQLIYHLVQEHVSLSKCGTLYDHQYLKLIKKVIPNLLCSVDKIHSITNFFRNISITCSPHDQVN